MLSLSDSNQSEAIEAFNSISWYLDDLLNIDNNFFDSMVNHIYPSELQLNRQTSQILRPHFWIYIYLYLMVLLKVLSLINGMTDLDIVNFLFLDCDVPRPTSYGVYISQLLLVLLECPVMSMTLILEISV